MYKSSQVEVFRALAPVRLWGVRHSVDGRGWSVFGLLPPAPPGLLPSGAIAYNYEWAEEVAAWARACGHPTAEIFEVALAVEPVSICTR